MFTLVSRGYLACDAMRKFSNVWVPQIRETDSPFGGSSQSRDRENFLFKGIVTQTFSCEYSQGDQPFKVLYEPGILLYLYTTSCELDKEGLSLSQMNARSVR